MVISKKYKGLETTRPSREVIQTQVTSYEEIDKALFNRRIDSSINDNRLLPCQKETLKRFDNYLFNLGSRLPTRARYLQTAKSMGSLIQKEFKDFTKQDVELFLSEYKDSKPKTHHNMKMYSRSFLRWVWREYHGWKESFEERYPLLVNWIVLKKQDGNKLPEDILSLEEVKKIISTTKDFRDRALLFVLYETAARRNEILHCKIKHVTFDDYGGFIVLPVSKTKPRKIRLIDSVPDLKTWLDSHPLKDDPEAALWVNLGSWKGCPLGVDGLKKLVKITAKNAGIKKNVYPHIFRHSRLTELAKEGFNETELRQIAGWSKDSNLPSTYIHIAGGDIDKKILLKAGLLNNSDVDKLEEQKKTLKIKECPNCKTKNTAVAKFCKNSSCNYILDYGFAKDVDRKRMESESLMSKIIERMSEKNKDLILETINELNLKKDIERI